MGRNKHLEPRTHFVTWHYFLLDWYLCGHGALRASMEPKHLDCEHCQPSPLLRCRSDAYNRSRTGEAVVYLFVLPSAQCFLVLGLLIAS
jgi:hypothetical protein